VRGLVANILSALEKVRCSGGQNVPIFALNEREGEIFAEPPDG